jgi:hypothetical protein
MIYEASANINSLTCIRWLFSSIVNRFGESQQEILTYYSDVENSIIEEAYTVKKPCVILDDYCIDFIGLFHIYNNDPHNQRPVKRVVYNRNDIHLREGRFTENPITLKRSFGDTYGWISPFIVAVTKNLKLEEKELSSYDETIVLMIVEKAALGIIEEGKKIGKNCEAEWIAKQLMERKNNGMKEVWKCCTNLYSRESFLYKKVNETMRSIDSDEPEQSWRSKLDTFGPFCLLLWNNPFNDKSTKKVEILYRSVTLSSAEIDSYKSDCSQNPKPERSFKAFISCSRNRALAEIYAGNTLLIIHVDYLFTMDLAPFSEYPHEEEVLLFPRIRFTIERMEFDQVKNKYLFCLNLKQNHDSKSILYVKYLFPIFFR